jgi:type I restriction enzyme S subunit
MWAKVKLGEVCTFQNGRAFKKSEWSETGLPIIRIQNLKKVVTEHNFFDGEYDERIFVRNGDLLLSWSGTIKTFIWCHDDALLNQHVFKVSVSKSLDQAYAYHLLNNILEEISKHKVGIGLQHITKKTFDNFEIILPPLAEQERIVAKLDTAFAEIEKLVTAQSSKLRETDSLIASALEKMLMQHGKAEIPVELQSLCESNRGITYGVIKLGEEAENGIPCLRTSNVKKRKIVTKGMKRIAGELSREYERTILSGGEVLVNVRGTLGGVSVVPADMAGWNISREVAMVPIDTYKASADYISIWISSPTSEKWLHGNTKGAAYQGINLSDLRKLPVALPAREVQDELVLQFNQLLRQIDTVKENIETAVNETATLKSAILAQELQSSEVA